MLKVLTSALTPIKTAINEMANYFTVDVDEPVHLHSLMGTISPTLKDLLGDLPTLLSIASAGKAQPTDINCIRGTVVFHGRLGFWLQPTGNSHSPGVDKLHEILSLGLWRTRETKTGKVALRPIQS